MDNTNRSSRGRNVPDTTLTPWPGSGHPGAMTIREKLYARRRAAKQAGEENQS